MDGVRPGSTAGLPRAAAGGTDRGAALLVGLVHAIGNALTGGDGFNAGYLANLHPNNSNVTLAHLLAFFVLGLGVVVVTRGRLGHPRTQGLSG